MCLLPRKDINRFFLTKKIVNFLVAETTTNQQVEDLYTEVTAIKSQISQILDLLKVQQPTLAPAAGQPTLPTPPTLGSSSSSRLAYPTAG